jgi:hypothetical protein
MFNWLFGKRKPEPARPTSTPAPTPGPTAAQVQAKQARQAEAAQAKAADMAVWQTRLTQAAGDDEALLAVASSAPQVDIKLAAVGAITGDAVLKRAEREFRSHDRRVYQLAKRRLGEAQARNDARRRADELIASATALLAEPVIAANRLVQIDQAWSAIDAQALDEPRTAAFASLSAQLSSRARGLADHLRALQRWVEGAQAVASEWTALAPKWADGSADREQGQAAAAALRQCLDGHPGVPGSPAADAMRTRLAAFQAQAAQIDQRLALLAEWAQWPAPTAAPLPVPEVVAPDPVVDGRDGAVAAPDVAEVLEPAVVADAPTAVDASDAEPVSAEVATTEQGAAAEADLAADTEAAAEALTGNPVAEAAEAVMAGAPTAEIPETATDGIAAVDATEAGAAEAAPVDEVSAEAPAEAHEPPSADAPVAEAPATVPAQADPAAVDGAAAPAEPATPDPTAIWQALPPVGDTALAAVLDARLRRWLQSRVVVRQPVRPPAAPRREREPAPTRPPLPKLAAVDIGASLAQAETALEQGQVAQAGAALAAIERAIAGDANAAPESQRNRLHALRAEIGRLKAWQQWGGERARDDLVAQAEALAVAALAPVGPGSPELAIRPHADAIDDLRKRWKEIDRTGSASPQPLWLRFDAALKTAFGPVAAHRDKLDAERRDNLAAREMLLAMLDAVGLDGSNAAAFTPAPVAAPPAAPGDEAAAARERDAAVTVTADSATAADGADTPVAAQAPAPADLAVEDAAGEAPDANGEAGDARVFAEGVATAPAGGSAAGMPISDAGANSADAMAGASDEAAPPDWRAVAFALDQFQREWRKLGPVEHTVPHAARDRLLARFREAVARLDEPLQRSRDAARGAREGLIAQARDAATRMAADPQSRDIVAWVRDLQGQWQQQARTMRLANAVENALWKDFKAATDSVFALRDAAIAERGNQFAANLAARQALIARLEAVDPLAAVNEIRQAMAEVDAQWRDAGEVLRADAAAIESRYRQARDAVTQLLADHARRAWLAVCDRLGAKLVLCEAREDHAGADEAGGAGIQTLAERWAALAPLAPLWEQALARRWQRPPSDPVAADPAELDATLLELESLLELPSPPPFEAARRELKLQALKASLEQRRPPGERFAAIDPLVVVAIGFSPTLPAQRERLRAVLVGLRDSAPPAAPRVAVVGRPGARR